jgi:hypothetical protein
MKDDGFFLDYSGFSFSLFSLGKSEEIMILINKSPYKSSLFNLSTRVYYVNSFTCQFSYIMFRGSLRGHFGRMIGFSLIHTYNNEYTVIDTGV